MVSDDGTPERIDDNAVKHLLNTFDLPHTGRNISLARATLANRAAVREPGKCDHMGCAVTTHTGATTGDCTRCGVTFVLPTLPGQRSVEPKTVTCSPITEPSMRHDEEWDGTVVRSPPVAPRPADAEGLPTSHDITQAAIATCARPGQFGAVEHPRSFRDGFREGANWMYDRVSPATPPAPQVSPNSSSTSQEVREALIAGANALQMAANDQPIPSGTPEWYSSPERIAERYRASAAVLRRLATPSDGPTE